jgi:predicted PurR-regulated permease PerM
LALSLLFAFILNPLVGLLQRWRLGRIPAVLLVVIFAFALLTGIGLAISFQVRNLAYELPQRKEQIVNKIAGVMEASRGGVFDRVQTTIQEIMQDILRRQGIQTSSGAQPIPVRIESPGYSQLLEAIGPAAEVLAVAGLVVVLVIFVLIRREDLRNRLVRLIGHGRLIVTTRALDEAGMRISRYLVAQVLINTVFGLVLGVGLFFLGVPYALLWGFIAAILRFVPYLGTWVAAALIMLFSVGMFEGWTRPLLVLGLYLVDELLTFNVLEPWLIGHSSGISSIALLVTAAFWTWLWGPIGLVLATPLTACMVVLGRYVPQLEFFNILLGDEPVLDAEVTYYQRLLAHDQDEAADLVEAHVQAHAPESVFDDVLIPALVLAKRDRDRGDLTADDEAYLLQVTRGVVEDLVPLLPAGTAKQCPPDPDGRPKIWIFGCPARDAEDELALCMLQQLLSPARCRMEVLSADILSGELVLRVEQEQPAIVCIGALAPGGQSQARYLCKRLRAHFPDLKILIGRWGVTEDAERLRTRLLAAGATAVATTLLESRNQVVPLVQVQAHVKAQAEEPALTPAGVA